MASKPVTTKVINSPESCVDDNLRGLVAAYPLLHLHPKHRVVTVRPTADTGKVAIIGGGGSGHEPFAAGFVGSGMLDGAVAGNIFASPPTGNVLYAIQHLYKHNTGGVFVLIGNYTGDRLNFGKAIEKAKIAGCKVEGVIAGEDIASSHNKTGGRGMLSEVFLFKMCGAMAAKGADLYSIRDLAVEVLPHMGTLGVCIGPCSLPGQPPLFEIAHGEMELGAGVHGEAGIAKIKTGTAKETVSLILEKIVEYLKLVSEDRVVAMINNLGGTSILEMNIISKEIKEYLGTKNITTERLYYGHLKSSLEMHGFQICLLRLPRHSGDYWLQLLDEPTNAPGWPGGEASLRRDGGVGDDESVFSSSDGRKDALGPSLTVDQQTILRNCLTAAAEEVRSNEALLNRLDSGCGDGDCGNTIAKFGQGSLLNATSPEVTSWLAAWRGAMAAITKYGGAEPGDRTMLDTLNAAYFEASQLVGKVELKTLLQKTAEAADRGAKATAGMTARAGRASYVSAEYTREEDAGARAAAAWLSAVCESLARHL